MQMNEVVIVSACRTPIGKFGGVFKNVSALDLTLPVMRELIMRAGVEPGIVDDVIWGCNYQRTNGENNIARVAAVKAGLPITVRCSWPTIKSNVVTQMSSWRVARIA
jgi:acetyl-CoA C-acetyltransferase